MPARRRRRRGRPAARPFLRRRSTLWLVAAIVTLAVGVTLGALATTDGDDEAPPAPTPTLAVGLPGIDPPAAAIERAEVLDVIDGDTVEVRLDGETERVRYFGVDTPERGDRCYDAARQRNEALAGDVLLLLPDVRERDQFDRLLRYAFDERRRSIDARLIAEGLGEAWRRDGAYRDELVDLEDEVRALGAGCLWEE